MHLHLFEFMDFPRIPRLLRDTLLEVLDFCNTTFRPWYRALAVDILDCAIQRESPCVAEPGAGSAPILREIAVLTATNTSSQARRLRLIPSDLYPVETVWRELQRQFPNIEPVYSPVDFLQSSPWPAESLLILAASLHHIPGAQRPQVIERLMSTADALLIHEPVRRTLPSLFLTSFCWFPALLTPAARLFQPGSFRRILLCWVVPIVPLMFLWDGLVSCLRQWTDAEWREYTCRASAAGLRIERETSMHSERILVTRVLPQARCA